MIDIQKLNNYLSQHESLNHIGI